MICRATKYPPAPKYLRDGAERQLLVCEELAEQLAQKLARMNVLMDILLMNLERNRIVEEYAQYGEDAFERFVDDFIKSAEVEE